MPGRDDLIQQNLARVQANAVAPKPQEAAGKSSSGTTTGSRSVSFFGGNYSVYSQLESIAFADKYGDYSMRNSVAYIQIWKRGGTGTQSGGNSAVQNPPQEDYSSQLSSAIDSALGAEGYNRESFAETGGTIQYSSTDSYAVITSPDFEQDDDGNIISGTRNTVFVPGKASERQQSISSQTPTNQSTQQRPGLVVGPSPFPQRPTTYPYFQSPRAFGPNPLFVPSQPLGPVVSGNPDGFLTLLGNIGIGAALGGVGFRGSYPSYLTGFTYQKGPNWSQANAPRQGNTISPLGTGIWQFLFNPSEMELDIGPEFKSAETWGVSDKANSGQPLHWSHNKNAQLKFNSVLLNGYVFGRKVEALEQGLIELFMMRDGPGQHGPHVLEFVWGKRTFGPCVIKNINIKEKMWDEGELVNAELSFTLEQVPEWTINDGAYVDVARPGRRPLQEEPAASTSPTTSSTSQQPPTTQNNTPGGGDTGDQKPNQQNAPRKSLQEVKCQNAFDYTANLKDLQGRVSGTRAIGAVETYNIQFSEFTTMIKGINASADIRFTDSSGQSFSSGANLRAFEDSWRRESQNDPFGLKRKTFLETNTQVVADRLGAAWNNSSVCPNTARSGR